MTEEIVSSRTRKSKAFASGGLFTCCSATALLHYESIPDSGIFDAEIDATPERVNNAQLDGWRVTVNSWHYAVGKPGDKTTDGWVGFGGRQGTHWLKFRLARVGYLH